MTDPRDRPPTRRRQARGAGVDPAREVALDVIVAVRTQDAYANLLLAHRLAERGLSTRDAAFATELVAGVLRRQGTYDAVIDVVAARTPRPELRDALRLGVHQLLAMRVPAHAAVATTVDLVRARLGPGRAGFANAVLRKVAAHDLASWVRRVAPDPTGDPVGFAAVAHSHPRWVVEALGSALAAQGRAGELDDLLAADNLAPKVSLVALPGLCEVAELEAAGGLRDRFGPLAAILPHGDPGTVAAVAEGRARVQDVGSQLVASALADAPIDGPDRLWLDLCAGPGGKSALLAATASRRGASLLAVERQPHRAALVVSATAAVPDGTVGVLVADGTRPPWPAGGFDRVLVDAPCSGLGALRRRPEARWRRSAADLATLVPLQTALLRSALDSVRPGGIVGYVTCSPVLAETAGVVSAVLAGRSDVRLQDAGAPAPDAPGPLAGTWQLWPHRHGTDAMFLALLRRSSSPAAGGGSPGHPGEPAPTPVSSPG